mmetsp:Transcript_27244/g.85282  ORF Transcript_27244/g.85282 Transcript_27244/m.85282 type:complete len:239 (-) Transcript_27244:1057-1773(-)
MAPRRAMPPVLSSDGSRGRKTSLASRERTNTLRPRSATSSSSGRLTSRSTMGETMGEATAPIGPESGLASASASSSAESKPSPPPSLREKKSAAARKALAAYVMCTPQTETTVDASWPRPGSLSTEWLTDSCAELAAAGSAAGSDHRSLLSREPVESAGRVPRPDGYPSPRQSWTASAALETLYTAESALWRAPMRTPPIHASSSGPPPSSRASSTAGRTRSSLRTTAAAAGGAGVSS